MGQMQPKVGGVDSVKATIRSIEENTSSTTEGTLKQSIVQNVTNSGLGSGEFKVPGAHRGNKS